VLHLLQSPFITIDSIQSEFDLSGEGWGVQLPLVKDDSLTGECKVWSGGSDSTPSERSKKSKFVVESL